jgi:hypothetical protein
MMPLSSTPGVVNTTVFPLAGVQTQAAAPIRVVGQAVNRSATY